MKRRPLLKGSGEDGARERPDLAGFILLNPGTKEKGGRLGDNVDHEGDDDENIKDQGEAPQTRHLPGQALRGENVKGPFPDVHDEDQEPQGKAKAVRVLDQIIGGVDDDEGGDQPDGEYQD